MDPYAECPCGSGKKIKFCCHEIYNEMQKVERLRENQPRLAINMLEELRHSHPLNPWVVTSEAMLQVQAGDPASARKSLAPFLKQHPTHPRANALYALACGQTDGFIATRKLANRAFKLCTPATVNTVGAIAIGLFQEHRERGQVMAARQLLSFVIRLTPEGEQKKNIVNLLLMLDAADSIPWPLRGTHAIPSYTPEEAVQTHVAKAHQLSKICCFDEAAALLKEAAEKSASSPELWHDLALHQAWEGNHDGAATSFHKASELYADPHLSVECEVLAQLLGMTEPVLELPRVVYMGRVNQPKTVLERLRAHGRLLESGMPEESESVGYRFTILSHEVPETSAALPVQDWPIHVGSISLITSSDEAEQALVQWSELEEVGSLVELVEGLFGDLLDPDFHNTKLDDDEPEEVVQEAPVASSPPPQPHAEEEDAFGAGLDFNAPAPPPVVESPPVAEASTPAAATTESEPAERRWITIPLPVSAIDRVAHRHMPPEGISAGDYREHVRQEVEAFVRDVWGQSALESLGGRTPADAIQTPELRARLEAAITVLDALSQAQNVMLARETVSRFLGEAAAAVVDAKSNLQGLSLFQLQRLNLESLTDEQIDHVIGRADLAQLPWLAKTALLERLRRKQDAKDRLPDLFALSQIEESLLDHPQAIDWINQAIEYASSLPNSFETLLGLKVRLVNLWMDYDPESQKCRDLLVDLWHNYGSKVPHLREQLSAAVRSAEIDPPWETAILVAAGDGSLEAPSGGAKKLILPGLD